MKKLILICFLIAVNVGCAKYQLNCHESCAINQMKCDGMEAHGNHQVMSGYTRDRQLFLVDSDPKTYQCSVTDDKDYLKRWIDSAYSRIKK
jgi:hypothetical protein